MNKQLKLLINIDNNYKNIVSKVGPLSMKKRILDNREVGKQLIGGKETIYRWLI